MPGTIKRKDHKIVNTTIKRFNNTDLPKSLKLSNNSFNSTFSPLVIFRCILAKANVIGAENKKANIPPTLGIKLKALDIADTINIQTKYIPILPLICSFADNFNSININAPTIVLNGEETSNEKKSVVLKKITEPLSLKRLELVNLLKKVKTQCENINEEKVLEYEEQINVQPVSKVLKK